MWLINEDEVIIHNSSMPPRESREAGANLLLKPVVCDRAAWIQVFKPSHEFTFLYFHSSDQHLYPHKYPVQDDRVNCWKN